MGNRPYVLRIARNPNGGASLRARCKEHDPQVSTYSGRQLFKELRVIFRPTMIRFYLGTARCGPACRVVWGLWEKIPRLPDYAESITCYDTDHKRLNGIALYFAIFHKLKACLPYLQKLVHRFFSTSGKEVDCVCRKSNLQPMY
jgi:hypothetical protein